MPRDLQNIIDFNHLPSLLWCEPELVQYLLKQNKAFQSTVSEKRSHVQHTVPVRAVSFSSSIEHKQCFLDIFSLINKEDNPLSKSAFILREGNFIKSN